MSSTSIQMLLQTLFREETWWSGLSPNAQGGIATGLIALLGIGISQLFTFRALKNQQSHDSKERREQRKFEMRQEVYLQFADDFTAAKRHLATLLEHELSEADAGLRAFFASSQKMEVVSEPKALEHVHRMNVSIGQWFFEALPAVAEVSSERVSSKTFIEATDRARAAAQEIVDDMDLRIRTGKMTDEDFRSLSLGRDSKQALASTFADENIKVLSNIARISQAYMLKYLKWMAETAEIDVEVFIAIREEMELSVDREVYRKRATEARIQSLAQIEILRQQMEQAATDL